jgi:IS5 family transposase
MSKFNGKSLFDEEIRLQQLSEFGDPLEKLNKMINFEEIFRTILNTIFKKEPKGPGGRPPYDYVMMFKVLILQRLYNISDGQAEFQIKDRLSFMRFLGLTLAQDVPDEKTIWYFREVLIKKGAIKRLFKKFDNYLNYQGVIANKGSIIDASFVEVPKQRNTREENNKIKEGKIPKEWEKNPNKLRQKDTDARWTEKNNEKYFGYKNHAKVDSKSKIITEFSVTDASEHDSQEFDDLINSKDNGKPIYGDSAYSGEPIQKKIKKRRMINKICEKGYRNNPLTDRQKDWNRKKSKIRARVEHVFGFIENSMNGSFIKNIGINRAEGVIGLMNLVYNMCRYQQLAR